MKEHHYTPEQLGKFTLPQLICLCSKKPADDSRITTSQDYQKFLEEETRKESEWNS